MLRQPNLSYLKVDIVSEQNVSSEKYLKKRISNILLGDVRNSFLKMFF